MIPDISYCLALLGESRAWIILISVPAICRCTLHPNKELSLRDNKACHTQHRPFAMFVQKDALDRSIAGYLDLVKPKECRDHKENA